MKVDAASLHEYDVDGSGNVPPAVAEAIIQSAAVQRDAKDHSGYAYVDSDEEDDEMDSSSLSATQSNIGECSYGQKF